MKRKIKNPFVTLWNMLSNTLTRIPKAELAPGMVQCKIQERSGLQYTRPFAVEWAEELRDHCQSNEVAFFLKQLGRNPSRDGKFFRLQHTHGGNWDEWQDDALKIREFPKTFHAYRKHEMEWSDDLRPTSIK